MDLNKMRQSGLEMMEIGAATQKEEKGKERKGKRRKKERPTYNDSQVLAAIGLDHYNISRAQDKLFLLFLVEKITPGSARFERNFEETEFLKL